MHMIRVSILSAVAAASLAPETEATQQFNELTAENRAFGMLSWPWVTEVDIEGTMQRFIWIVEDGGRIRFSDPFQNGDWFPSIHVPDQTIGSGGVSNAPDRQHDKIYRDIKVFQPNPEINEWCGITVGEDSQWSWAMGDLTSPSEANFEWNDRKKFDVVNPAGNVVVAPDLFDIEPVPDGEGGFRFWFVGEEHTIGYSTTLQNVDESAIVTPNPANFQLYPNVWGQGGTATLRTITFSSDGVFGFAAGDSVAYYTRDSGVTWKPSKFQDIPVIETSTPLFSAFEFLPDDSIGSVPGNIRNELWSGVIDVERANGTFSGYLAGGILTEAGRSIYRTSNSGRTWRRHRPSCGSLTPNCPDQTCPNPDFDPCTGSSWPFGDGARLNGPNVLATTTCYSAFRANDGGILVGGYLNNTMRRAAGTPSDRYRFDDVSGYCDPEIDLTTLWGLHGAPGSDFVIGVGAWGCVKSSNNNGLDWTSESKTRRWRFQDIAAVARADGESTVYLAGQNLRVARSDDSGRTWDQALERGELDVLDDAGGPFGSNQDDIAVIPSGIPGPEGDIAVSVGFITEGGSTRPFGLYTENLPNTCWAESTFSSAIQGSRVNAIDASTAALLSPNAPQNFYAVTDSREIIRSTDKGATWELFKTLAGTGALTTISVATDDFILCGGGTELFLLRNQPNGTPFPPTDLLTIPGERVNSVHTNGYAMFAAGRRGSQGRIWKLVVDSSIPIGFSLEMVPIPSGNFLENQELLSVAVSPGATTPGLGFEIMVGSSGGRLALIQEIFPGATVEFERIHSGLSSDIVDISIVKRSSDPGGGVAFFVSQTDSDRASTPDFLFGPVNTPSLMEIRF